MRSGGGRHPSRRWVSRSRNHRGKRWTCCGDDLSSNVGRIRSIAEAARDAGRQVLVLGRSLKRVISVSEELGYMEGIPPFIAEEDYMAVARNKLVIICTGSQGEALAALAKLSRDEMKTVSLTAGDTVIFSSRTIPGNERRSWRSRTGSSISA